MSSGRRRTVLLFGAAIALSIAVAAPAIRTSALQAAGWALVHNESLEPTDAIVVVGGDRTTLLEAADPVRIRTARYPAFDPDRWWRSRDGVRTGVIELQKLLLDYARHPR